MLEEFIKEHYDLNENNLEIDELKRIYQLLLDITNETFYKFKIKLNLKKENYITVTNGLFYRKIIVTYIEGTKSYYMSILDKPGYEKHFISNSFKEIKSPDEMATYLGITKEKYKNSKELKSY